MLVMGCPQFQPQDEVEFKNLVAPIPQMEIGLTHPDSSGLFLPFHSFDNFDVDHTIGEVLTNLQTISHQYRVTSQPDLPSMLTIPEIHDLASFVLHTLLQPPHPEILVSISECIRYGLCIYMFLLHGPTYYSHAVILSTLVLRLQHQLEALVPQGLLCEEAHTWTLSMGLVGSVGTEAHEWFSKQCAIISSRLAIHDWEFVSHQLERIAWLPSVMCEMAFRQSWEAIITSQTQTITSLVGVKADVDE